MRQQHATDNASISLHAAAAAAAADMETLCWKTAGRKQSKCGAAVQVALFPGILRWLEQLTAPQGQLAGSLDTAHVGLAGHSRGGKLAALVTTGLLLITAAACHLHVCLMHGERWSCLQATGSA